MVEVLGEHDIAARLLDEVDSASRRTLDRPGTASCWSPRAASTTVWSSTSPGWSILTGEDIAGQKATTRDMRKMPARRKKQIDPLELKAGDYVVHEQHGVGRFVEMKQREVHGAVREYLVLEYGASKRGHPPDRLYVPADALDQVTRYVGGEQPSLDRLGGADWAKRKGRARKAVRQIAAELIKLYAARQATQGHAFGPDTPWQTELEDAFPFHETPDQLSTVEEVKADMRRVVPMDRLVCGDVGYGKTEIAVRAAFKAVQEGKQVAVLVPTTLLVTQHHATFAERMSGFPVNLRPLSRFQTDKEAREVVEGLADGSVDIVIGTHRLLNRDIKIKDLGLIVVDEEQRFGVEHKEQMKALRTSVDVLSMSATPIPRTLEMAITGIREMSTIATPPEERHPVLTYVGAYEDRQVAAAVRRELLRDGQVFYIHNRVQSIEKAANRIKELVPEARVATAHGQMGEHRLEQVMLDFWEKRFDVLVCTTIVESGLDVSNANTMIIERSDTLGPLPAAPAARTRGPVARARLRLLPLPAGQAADRDRARAAGHARPALRPRRRHGDRHEGPRDPRRRQPARRRAVRPHRRRRLRPLRAARRRGGLRVPPGRRRRSSSRSRSRSSCPSTRTCRTTTSGSERLRLEMYKRLAEVRSDEDVRLLHEELLDRYGTPPDPVTRLLAVASFRARARQVGAVGGHHPGQVRALPSRRAARLARRTPEPAAPEKPLQGARAYHAGAAATAVRLRCAASSRRGAARLGQTGDRRRDRENR